MARVARYAYALLVPAEFTALSAFMTGELRPRHFASFVLFLGMALVYDLRFRPAEERRERPRYWAKLEKSAWGLGLFTPVAICVAIDHPWLAGIGSALFLGVTAWQVGPRYARFVARTTAEGLDLRRLWTTSEVRREEIEALEHGFLGPRLRSKGGRTFLLADSDSFSVGIGAIATRRYERRAAC